MSRYLYVKYVEFPSLWKESYKEDRKMHEILNYMFFDKTMNLMNSSGFYVWVSSKDGHGVFIADTLYYNPQDHEYNSFYDDIFMSLTREQKINQILEF